MAVLEKDVQEKLDKHRTEKAEQKNQEETKSSVKFAITSKTL